MQKNRSRLICLLLFTASLSAGCAPDITGEIKLLEKKSSSEYKVFSILFPQDFRITWSVNGNSVDVAISGQAESGPKLAMVCTYKLNESKSAWLLTNDEGKCSSSFSIP